MKGSQMNDWQSVFPLLTDVNIIAIAGKAQHGKSTTCNWIHDKYGGAEFSFAEALKEISNLIFRTPGLFQNEKYKKELISTLSLLRNKGIEIKSSSGDTDIDYTARGALQYIGQFLRNYWEDIWVYALFKHINTVFQMIAHDSARLKDSLVIVPDLRYKNELDALKSIGAITIKVIRTDFNNDTVLTKKQQNHSSEMELDSIPEDEFTYIIKAKDIKELNEQLELLPLWTQIRRLYD